MRRPLDRRSGGALHHVRIDSIEIEPAATGKFHESASLRAEGGLVAEIRDELASPQRPSGSRSAVDRHGSWVSATISTPLSTAAAMQYTVTAPGSSQYPVSRYSLTVPFNRRGGRLR